MATIFTVVFLLIFGVTLVASIFGIVHASLMLRRNRDVFAWRTAMLNRVSKASREDISQGRDYEWRYDEFDAVTYEEMVDNRKQPLDSFYPRDPARHER